MKIKHMMWGNFPLYSFTEYDKNIKKIEVHEKYDYPYFKGMSIPVINNLTLGPATNKKSWINIYL